MTSRPVEVDTRLAELWDARFDLARTVAWKTDAVHVAMGERRGRDPRTWRDLPWETPDETAVEAARALAATAPDRYPDAYDPAVWAAMAARKAIMEYDAAVAAIEANDREAAPLEAEYDRERWSRFFLVTNANGHIHRDMRCSTCRWDTRYAWLPTLSGLTEADAVAQEGTRLCSVCFPTAPVEWTVGLPPKVDPDRCPGSGQPARGVERQYQRRVRDNRTGEIRTVTGTVMDLFCPVCGREATETRTGDVRAHKAPKARKGR